jgi:hypothetical protein
MTSTSIRTDRGASQTLSGGTRNAGNRAMRAAGRQLLATAGNQVLKVAVDRAVGKVDQVADRLDTVAAGGGRSPRSAPARQPPERPTGSGGQRPEHPIRVKMGVAFSFVVQQAVHLLQLIQRLAQQLLGALTRLLRRLQKLLGALVHRGVAAALQTIHPLREKLKDVTSRRGGVVMGAAGGLLKALGAGTNPVWGAVKGAIGGLSTKTKVLIVLALVLGLLLGPVVLVVVLLALLVFAVVAAVRTRAPT